MKTILALVFSLTFPAVSFASEIIKVPLSDGETMVGKLEMPAGVAKVGEIDIRGDKEDVRDGGNA